jgi:hypothetical protein
LLTVFVFNRHDDPAKAGAGRAESAASRETLTMSDCAKPSMIMRLLRSWLIVGVCVAFGAMTGIGIGWIEVGRNFVDGPVPWYRLSNALVYGGSFAAFAGFYAWAISWLLTWSGETELDEMKWNS